MKQENLETLGRILSTLMAIETRGENTIYMAQCLQALQSIIQDESEASTKEGE